MIISFFCPFRAGERQLVMKNKNSYYSCSDSEKNNTIMSFLFFLFKITIAYCLNEMRGNSYINKTPTYQHW